MPDAAITIHVTNQPDQPPAPRPVRVTVSGCLVSFDGVPTLWLNQPYPADQVLADPVTQHVAAMYAHGYRHHA